MLTYEQFEMIMDKATKDLISKEYAFCVHTSMKSKAEKYVLLYALTKGTLVKVITDDTISKDKCYIGDYKEFSAAVDEMRKLYGKL